MRYGRVKNWPPVWVMGSKGKITGETGILKDIRRDARNGKRCYLVIEHEGDRYHGALLFDDPMFCSLISGVLENHRGWSIKDIGDLDLWQTF
jgi:hypothetical protein